jgi:protein-S-isoprenylcysteine O-methyltransferase Ste14
MHGLIRHEIKRDLLRFGLPGIVVLFLGLITCAADGYDGLTETLWELATGQRSPSELSLANVLGLTIFVLGLTVAIVAAFTLKRSYSSSLVIREGHRLVTHGLYRVVRHPIYLGVLVAISGVPVYASSVKGALVLALLVPLILLRIRMEEGLLAEHFGDEYCAYRARTRKLIPFVH